MSIDMEEWVLCPRCNSKTRIKIRRDTVAENFPLFCPKCKLNMLVNIKNFKIEAVKKEPDAN